MAEDEIFLSPLLLSYAMVVDYLAIDGVGFRRTHGCD